MVYERASVLGYRYIACLGYPAIYTICILSFKKSGCERRTLFQASSSGAHMGFLKGPYKYVHVATPWIATKIQLSSSVAVQRSQAGPISDAVRESDGDSTVAAPYYQSYHDRTMTRIRGIISSIIWTSTDITWDFCGSVLKIEGETEKKVVQEMARCQELRSCEFIDRPSNQQVT